MGSLCQGLFGSSASTTYQPPQAVTNAITDILGRAATQSNQPYPQYTPDTAAQYSNYNAGLLAPMTPNQTQAGQSIAGLQGYTAPNFGAATNLVANAANPLQMQQFSQNSVNQYMNPYLNDVVGSAVSNINQTNAQQQQQVLGNAIGQGAYGGDRAGIAQAELARQQGLANNATIANLLGQGYSQAQGQFNQQQQTDLATQLQNRNLMTNAGLNLANLGTQGQQAALQQAKAQYGYGTAEQQQQQAGLSTAYQQYMNQQAFPYQQLSYYAGLASGAAPAMGGTTTGYSPTVSNAGGVLGSLGILGGLTNPGAISPSNPWSGISAGIGTITGGGLFGFKDGGRANYDNGGRTAYADAGAVSVSPITQAYNDYNNAVAAGAPYDVLQQLYQKYQKSFQGAANPWEGTTTPTATPAKTAAIATSEATPSDNSNRGGNGGGNGPITARNADYSPDFTSSNGPVGQAGGYGPYYNGGGPGNAFDKANGKGGLSGIMGGLLGGVDKTTGAQTGIMGAFDALAHGNSPGTLNNVLNARNTVAYGTREDGSAYPNTTSGMTAQEFANKFGLDVSQVKGSIVNGQIDWYNGDNKLADILHGGGLPASQLSGVIGSAGTIGIENPERPIDERAGFYGTPADSGADLPAAKTAGEGYGGNMPTGSVGSRATGFTGDYAKIAHDLEVQYSLPEGALAGIANVETGGTYNPNISNPSGTSKGLMQFQDPTSAKYNLQNPFDPIAALTAGAQYAADIANSQGNNATVGSIGLAYNQGQNGFNSLRNADPNARAVDVLGKNFLSNRFGLPVDATVGDFIKSAENAYQKGAIPTPQEKFDPSNPPMPPSNPEYSKGLSEIQAGQNVPGVGAASEGHGGGGGGLDRTVSAPDNSSNESGSSFGGRGNGPSVGDSSQGNGGGEGGGGGGEGASGRSGGAWHNGGLIHPHHYADGGFTPFHMQYGLPSGSDIEQQAQDYAGSGAGVLAPQLEALAAKGVLPSAKGGRIHAQTGVGISADDTANNQAGLNWWDPGYDAAKNPERLERLNKNAQKEADIQKMPEWQYLLGSAGKTVVDAATNAGNSAKSMFDYLNAPHGNVDPSTSVPQGNTPPVIPAAKPVPGSGNASTFVPDWAKEGYNPVRTASGTNTDPYNPRSASGTYTQPYEKTQPIDPAKSFVVDQGVNNVADESVETAPTAPSKTAPQRKDVAPGIKEWYNAPPPVDMRQMAALNFGANLLAGGDFGSNLARAGHDYANTMLAQQDQQRATMLNESESALKRSQGIEAGARTAKERIQPMGLGYSIVSGTGTPDDPIMLTGIQGADGQAGGTTMQGGVGGVGGKTAQIVMKQPYNGETYLPDFSDNPQAQQTAAANLTMLGNQAKAAMPMQPELAKKNYELSQAEVQAARQDAKLAADNIVPYTEVMDAIHAMPQGGPLTPGLTGKARYTAIAGLNDAAKAVGIDLGLTDTMSSAEIMQKFATAAANQTSESRAAKWLETTAASLPSIGLNLPTMQKLAANQFTAAYTKQIYANTVAKLASESDGQDRDMTGHFYAVNPRQNQVKLQNAIYKLMNSHQKEGGKVDGAWIKNPETGRYETPISMFQHNQLTAEQFNKISYNLTGMKNMSSVFGAGQ